MKRRHNNHMNGGHNNNRGGHRPQGRYNNNGQKPRRNFGALREKYLNMAKDAMSAGDRVLAEYYLQHADHYFRMQQEFLAERAARQQSQPAGAPDEADDPGEDDGEEEVNIPNNSNVLPAFLTRQVPPAQTGQADEKAVANVGWEEE